MLSMENMTNNNFEITIREIKILELRFGLNGEKPKTLEEVGREFDVTRERIRQLEAKALTIMGIYDEVVYNKKDLCLSDLQKLVKNGIKKYAPKNKKGKA